MSDIISSVPDFEREDPLANNPYKADIERLANDAPHFNEKQLTGLVNQTLVEAIIADAQAGKFNEQQKDPLTGAVEIKQYTVEDLVMGEFEKALQALDASPRSADWEQFIPSANGLRGAVSEIMKNKRLSEPFRYAIFHRQADIIRQRDADTEPIAIISPEVAAFRAEVADDLGEEAVEDSGVVVEASVAQRFADLPKPVEREPKGPYDYLRQALPPVVRESAAPEMQKYYDKFVTEENRQESLNTFSEVFKAVPAIEQVLVEANIPPLSLEAVDAIRSNADVRFEVAKILASRLDVLASQPGTDIGPRVVENSPQNLKSDMVLNEKLLSRTHAVKMALKMLGGEYSEKADPSTGYERDENSGRVTHGQHRYAALQALRSYSV